MPHEPTRRRRRRLPPGLYWVPADVGGAETLMAVDRRGEAIIGTVGAEKSEAQVIGELEDWLKARGVSVDASRPALFVI